MNRTSGLKPMSDAIYSPDQRTAAPLTLNDLLYFIWRAKFYWLTGVIFFGVIGILVFTSVQPFYKSQMIVGPANPINGAEASSLLADENLFALRYLVQRVGVASSSDFVRFESMFSGVSVASLLMEDEAIYKGLQNDYIYASRRKAPKWEASWLADYIDRRVTLHPVNATPLRRMVYFHPDPEFGQYFLSRIHTLTDALIRQTIRAETIERVQYLQGAVEETRNPEHRRALTTLLLEQERLRMLVSIDQPYAAAIVEPASSSYKPRWPDVYILMSGFVAVGFMLGLMSYGWRRSYA